MGVWIEIANAGNDYGIVSVTPYVGVWIEIPSSKGSGMMLSSPPMWGCGLKLMITNTVLLRSIVTPYVGVWIEIR